MAVIKTQCTVIGNLLDKPVYKPARNGKGARLTAVLINTPRHYDDHTQHWSNIPGAEPVRILVRLNGKNAEAIQRSLDLNMIKIGDPLIACGRLDDRPHMRETDEGVTAIQVLYASSLNPDLITLITRQGC